MTLRIFTFALLAFIAGCGGGGGGGDSNQTNNPPQVDASPGGIWEGSTSQGDQLLGLVTESGEFHFITDFGVQYFGTLSMDGNEVSASFTGVTPVGVTFVDGTVSGTGTLTGVVQERTSISATSTFTTSAGNTDSATITLTYNDLYERDSSLQTAAGNYLQVGTNDIVNVNSDGTVFMQDPDSGCVINGHVSIINASFNAYRAEYSYGNCVGDAAFLNGRQFRGLAALDNTIDPEQFLLGAVTPSGSPRLAAVFLFERT